MRVLLMHGRVLLLALQARNPLVLLLQPPPHRNRS